MQDPYGHGETVPFWVVCLVALALILALMFGVAATAHANPSSLPVFLGRGATPVVFRSKTSGSGTSVTIPAGVAVGDLAVVVSATGQTGNTLTSGGGVWSSFSINGGGTNCGGSSCTTSILWKVLVLADLTGSWTLTNSISYSALDYIGNGATTLARRETETNYTATSVAFTGYTPVLSSRGALSVFLSSTTTATTPSGFTLRDTVTGSAPYNKTAIADLLNYQSGGFTWTGLDIATGGYGGLLEFSGP
jgi:hypothetical protein